jgi:23S rRNA pseudouridine2605 synthase
MKKKSTQFDKFTKKKSNAAIKEQFKQEKRKFKKEREEYFDSKRSQRPDVRGQKESSKPDPAVPASYLRPQTSDLMPLNKFIAHAGISGRREAAEIVKKGLVKVNGVLITEPGHKVSVKDDIRINGKRAFPAKDLVYILLNKPKDYITTTDDPHGRKTVLDLIKHATQERVYPVGRLDRNTSGVLLFTNDGELSQKLTHPSNEIKKVYAVTLNKPLEKKDFDQILKGVVLEDGMAHVDALAYADVKDKTILGVEIHSGRNRIVRRIFEALGYDVRNLDRVIFAGLTKKNIERGKWRFLNEKEVRDLKYFGKGK